MKKVTGNRSNTSFREVYKQQRPSDKRWKKTRQAVFWRDRYKCQQCGKGGRLECDHIKPLSQGGAALDMRNLQTLCRHCHFSKTMKEAGVPESKVAWRNYIKNMIE